MVAYFPLTRELALQLENYIDDIASARPIVDESAYAIATKCRVLPLMRGVEGYYAMTLTGEVVVFEWRRFEEPMPEFLLGRRLGVIAAASQRYPELSVLLPSRDSEDRDCDYCHGTGAHPLRDETGDPRVICECGGTGFCPRESAAADIVVPSKNDTPVFPNFTPSKYTSGRSHEIVADEDVQSEEELRRLLDAMYDRPERQFVYYSPTGRAGNAQIADALANSIIVRGEVENFYYRRELGSRNFVHVEPHVLDDSQAELVFALEKRHFLFLTRLAEGEMYSKSVLTLTERTRHAIAAERTRDTKLVDVKWGCFGVKLDMRKLWSILRAWKD